MYFRGFLVGHPEDLYRYDLGDLVAEQHQKEVEEAVECI
jgi:hypothetical protein